MLNPSVVMVMEEMGLPNPLTLLEGVGGRMVVVHQIKTGGGTYGRQRVIWDKLESRGLVRNKEVTAGHGGLASTGGVKANTLYLYWRGGGHTSSGADQRKKGSIEVFMPRLSNEGMRKLAFYVAVLIDAGYSIAIGGSPSINDDNLWDVISKQFGADDLSQPTAEDNPDLAKLVFGGGDMTDATSKEVMLAWHQVRHWLTKDKLEQSSNHTVEFDVERFRAGRVAKALDTLKQHGEVDFIRVDNPESQSVRFLVEKMPDK